MKEFEMLTTAKVPEMLSDNHLHALYREAVGSPIHVTFSGGIILDPHTVYVTRDQAHQASEHLRKMLNARNP